VTPPAANAGKMRVVCAAAVLALLAPAASASSANVAALQAALYGRGLYAGAVDGVSGPGTTTAVRRLQRRAGLVPDGVAGPRTRRALGRVGRHPFGSRPLHAGDVGWDVAALQFLLESHGFPCGGVDGGFGARTVAAVERLQAHYGLPVVGVVGPATRAALFRPPAASPLRLALPVRAAVGDRYGPRGNGWHAGLDFPAPSGTPVAAAGAGRVLFAGWDDGFGLTVVIAHALGVHTRYAHLRSIAVRPGEAVATGALVGRVGQTGRATGPHLHFEVTVRGANADPGPALGV
jgi:murein DD-endopeptidase MepM/ murein hydrolase activator NlpD